MAIEHIHHTFSVEYVMPEKLEKTYQIERCKLEETPSDASNLVDLFKSKTAVDALQRTQESYLSWAEFRKKSWVPDKKELLWKIVSLQRSTSNRPTQIKDKEGRYYKFNPNSHLEFLHEVDLELGGNLLGLQNFGEGDKRQIIRRNLIEESIASSKLEGANTSRDAARRMLTEGRKPRDKDELMIVNNHQAMVRIEEELKHQELSIELLRELHRLVTHGTLANEDHEGSIRDTLDSNGNRLKIMPWDSHTIAYVTPDREFVEEQLPKLIEFANDKDNSGFIHPLFKAIMLHFWIGLLHPFEDGNGRLARIIFYWYMLRKKYWAFSYLSLSERIVKSPSQYAMAYVNTEQDNFDLNYFIHYNIEKLKLARQQLQLYLAKKIEDNRAAVQLAQNEFGFNQRQIRLLQFLAVDEERMTNPSAYQNINPDVGYVTILSDLRRLVDGGFLKKKKVGRNVYYRPTESVAKLLK